MQYIHWSEVQPDGMLMTALVYLGWLAVGGSNDQLFPENTAWLQEDAGHKRSIDIAFSIQEAQLLHVASSWKRCKALICSARCINLI